jgi:hypothetical protein
MNRMRLVLFDWNSRMFRPSAPRVPCVCEPWRPPPSEVCLSVCGQLRKDREAEMAAAARAPIALLALYELLYLYPGQVHLHWHPRPPCGHACTHAHTGDPSCVQTAL